AEAERGQPYQHGDQRGDRSRDDEDDRQPDVMGVGTRRRVGAHPEQREMTEGGLSGPARQQREGEAHDGVRQDEHEGVGALLAPEAREVRQGQTGQGEEAPAVTAEIPGEMKAGEALAQRWARPVDDELAVSARRRRRQLPAPYA